MASKEEIQIKIDAAVESAEAAKSLGQLRKSLIEIQTLQAEIGDTSGAQFDKLSQASSNASAKLAETRDRIGDIQDKTRTLEGTAVERLTGSFGLLKESILNLDFDKAKIGAEGLLNTFTPVVDGKLVTGLAGVKGAFGMLADGVKTLGSTFMTVGKALLTNPIFLLAAAIIAIVAVVILIMDKLGILKKIMDALGYAIGLVVKAFEALTDWLGLTTNAQEDAAASAKELGETQRGEIDATANKQKQHLKDIEGMTDAEIAEYRRKAGIKDTLNQNSFDIEKNRLIQTQKTLANEINALNELKDAGGELTDEQLKDLEQRKKDYKANADAIVSIEEQKVKAILESSKKITNSLRDWKIKNIQDDNKRSKEESKVKEAEDILKIDVELANARRLHGEQSKEVKELEAQKTEVHTYYSNLRDGITKAEYKKAVDNANAATQKALAAKEKENEALLASIEKKRSNELKNEKLTADEKLVINSKYDKSILDQTKINEDGLFKWKKEHSIIKGNDIVIEEQRIRENQAKRKELFETEQLAQYNEKRKIEVDNNLQKLQNELTAELVKVGDNADAKLEVEKSYDERLFAARKVQIQTYAEAELSDLTKTEGEKESIKLKAWQDITALEEEAAQKKKEYQIKELEDTKTTQGRILESRQFETEQLIENGNKIKISDYERNADYIKQYRKRAEESLLISEDLAKQLSYLNASEVYDLKAAMDLELSNTELTEAQKYEIRERYRQLNIEQEQAADERLKQAKLAELSEIAEYAEKGLKSVNEISDAAFAWKQRNLNKETEALMKNLTAGTKEYDIANAKKFKMEQDLARKMFNTNKALQLSSAVIDGFKSITTSLSMSPVAIGPIPNPAGIASLAFAAITTAANIAKIAASKFQEGTAPAATVTTPNPDLGGGGGEGGGATNFNPNQFFGLGQQTAMGMPGGPKPVKVYVTETDIRDVSDRVSVIEQRAIY